MNSTRLYLDTETTGMGKNDRVCQIALLVDNGNTVESFEDIVNPRCKINKKASEVHNIYPEDVFGMPLIHNSGTFKTLLRYNNSSTYLFIHNANFDLRMLGYDGFKSRCIVIDTLKCARVLLREKSNRLEDLRKSSDISRKESLIMKRLNIETITSHDALGDVISMKALVDTLLDKYSIEKLVKTGRYVHVNKK